MTTQRDRRDARRVRPNPVPQKPIDPLAGLAPTDRQLAVLEAIRAYIRKHGYSPTVRALGALIGVRSTNGVAEHLRALERRGLLTRQRGTRTIRVTGACPVCGRGAH